jgi:hypothetical protein
LRISRVFSVEGGNSNWRRSRIVVSLSATKSVN